MSKFYTNVTPKGDNLLVCGYENGKKVNFKVPYKPYLFLPSKTKEDYTTLDGKFVTRMDFGSISDAREFIKEYSGVDGFEIFGMTIWQYPFINDYYQSPIDFDPKLISVVIIDIEVAANEGFPSVDIANKPITAITLKHRDQSIVLGCGIYKPHMENIRYVKCRDEEHLLREFIHEWQTIQPDVVTGWNVEMFDIPYIHNRVKNVLSKQDANKLSPWNIVDDREIKMTGGMTYIAKMIAGVSVLDYLQLYKKFSYTPQESYRLDHIANYELGEKKLDYSEYDSLLDLYKNDFQKFIEYNIKDCELVDKLEEKLKFIDQVFTLAYDGRVNYIDTFTTVRMWDVIIHNYLLGQGIVVPQTKVPDEDEPIVGAYVKDPQTGMHLSLIHI